MGHGFCWWAVYAHFILTLRTYPTYQRREGHPPLGWQQIAA
ncbi:hypothetical protein AcetOrient_orf01955 [Acetobacter orientalis]|uniref:Uncharacterized protein n=1 Tax=Acetobacter orientalis TaxID=146474 RepID=A0A2Z5ZGG2_9PROT|nr:hypothetical protein AcetOrient_orf01955 [Acetobacter orientalis]